MAAAGRKPKPVVQAIREGNPGKRSLKDAVVLPPSALREPDWEQVIPGERDDQSRARDTAGGLWRKLAPTLSRSIGLVGEQQETLVDYCVTWARIEQGERAVSLEGMIIPGAMGGTVKNPWTTVLNQYRSHLRSLIGELGLSPASAARLTRPESDDEDDPFD